MSKEANAAKECKGAVRGLRSNPKDVPKEQTPRSTRAERSSLVGHLCRRLRRRCQSSPGMRRRTAVELEQEEPAQVIGAQN